MKSTLQLFKESLAEMRARSRFYATLLLVPAVLSAFVAFFEPELAFDGSSVWRSGGHATTYGVLVFIYMVVSLFTTMGLILSLENKALTALDACKSATHFVLRYIGLVIVSTIAIGIGFVLLLIPGIWLSVALMFSVFFLVLRGDGIIQSLKKSRLLVKGRWWNTLGKLLLFGIFMVFLYIVVTILLIPVNMFAGDTFSYMVQAVLGVLGGALSLIFAYLLFRELENTQSAMVQQNPIQ